MKTPITCLLVLCLAIAAGFAQDKTPAKAPAARPLKALFFAGGGYHDYAKLAPLLTSKLSGPASVQFSVQTNMDLLANPNFADGYDVVVYDFCYDEADPRFLLNAMAATKAGKPAVLIHCAVHAFRRAPEIKAWEEFCGMRSKIHDPYEPFTVDKTDVVHPTTKNFPDHWQDPGDELYQTIEFLPGSTALLKAKSPHDGRVHTVCWVHEYGKGRVFATTLGHDVKAADTAEYAQLLTDGILWAAGRQ